MLYIILGSPEMCNAIINKLSNSWLELTFDKFGCRVVQKQLDHIKPAQYQSLLNGIQGKTLALIFDQCGNHVL